jgi:outer membrane protein assembly factor BamB
MNTVGCYTFPSIGESDSMFKLDAATGAVVWRNRVDAPEQFGACAADTAIDCGVAGDCPSGACNTKAFYHDFGFLNGPLLVEVPDGGGTKTLVVSGSKNGTLYAFEEDTGTIAWTNVVRIKPVSPGFAAWGMFNGAITFDGGRIYAALHGPAPARVCANDARVGCNDDGDCPGSVCPAERKHLMAFDATTGATVWEEEIGRSWAHAAVANGVVFAGTNDEADDASSWIYAHDAATGARLRTFDVPSTSTARAAVAGDTLVLAYGINSGGLRGYALCANARIDPGEECDGGPGSPCCSAACTFATGTCDDGDTCTGGDACGAGVCAGAITTTEQVGCRLSALGDSPCDTALPSGLTKSIARALEKIEKVLAKAAASEKPAKVERYRRQALKALDGIAKKAGKAEKARKEAKRISTDCRGAIDALVAERRTLVEEFVF